MGARAAAEKWVMEGGRSGGPKREEVIRAQGLGKEFRLYQRDRDRILDLFGRDRHMVLWALKDVNFTVHSGEALGIIGSNGAGKSTLLRLLAGVSRPTEGILQVKKSISSLLDLGLGFHDSFSGRENIYLNCTLQGMERSQVDEMVPAIVEFAELEAFIDYPVKTYSAGMKLRLGFSISAFMNYDIFLIDEVLTVGDQYFQRKCIRKIEEFIDNGKTIILVSHDLHAVRSLCDSAIWLKEGQIVDQGSAVEVVDAYVDSVRAREGGKLIRARKRLQAREAQNKRKRRNTTAVSMREVATVDYQDTGSGEGIKSRVIDAMYLPSAHEIWQQKHEAEPYHQYQGEQPMVTGTGEARLLELKIMGASGAEQKEFRTHEDLLVALTIKTVEPIQDPIFGVAIHRSDDVYVFGPNSQFDKTLFGTYHGIYTFFYHIPRLPLLTGTYMLSVALWHKSHLKPYIWHNRLYEISILADRNDHGMVLMDHHWGLITHVRGDQEKLGSDGSESP